MRDRSRVLITLACADCASRNYRTSRKHDGTRSLELKKYCPKCKKHTIHRETK